MMRANPSMVMLRSLMYIAAPTYALICIKLNCLTKSHFSSSLYFIQPIVGFIFRFGRYNQQQDPVLLFAAVDNFVTASHLKQKLYVSFALPYK